jgi:hypothetical protein
MLRVAAEAHITRIMGMNQQRSVTIDIIPARAMFLAPRLDPDDDSLTAPTPTVQTLTFHLEDQMFGTVVYAAITCQGRVIVNPFKWESWDHLARSAINVPR